MPFIHTLKSDTGEFWFGDLTTTHSLKEASQLIMHGLDYHTRTNSITMQVDTELLLIPSRRSVHLPSEVLGILPTDYCYKKNPRYGFVVPYAEITVEERNDKVYVLNREVPLDAQINPPDVLLVFKRVNDIFAVVENNVTDLRSVPEAVSAAESLADLIIQTRSADSPAQTMEELKTNFKRATDNLKTIGKYLKGWERLISHTSNMTLVPFREYQVKVTASEAGIVNRTLIVYTNGRPDDRDYVTTLFKAKIASDFGDLSFLAALMPRMSFSEKGESLVIKASDEAKKKDYRLYLTGYRSFVYLPIDVMGAIEVKDTVWEA